MNKKCKKAISFFTVLTTILWMSGVAMIPMAGAVTINEGDLIRGPDGIKVYIINANGFKRHIFNPEVFNMYGHLKWSNIKSVDQATLDSYKISDLYRVATGFKVFSVTADGKQRHFNMTAAQFVASGYSWDQIFVINEKEGVYYTLGADLTYGAVTPSPTVSPTASPTATPVAGPLTVVLAADNPVSANIPAAVTAAPFLKFTVGGITTLTEVVVKRSGAGTAGDFANVYLYDGATRLTSGRSVASDTNTATFVNLNLAVGTGKTLTVKADIAAWATVTGKQDRFEVVSINGTAVTGIVGNLMSYANVTTGTATIVETSAAWSGTLGSSAVELAKFSITETSGLHTLIVSGITIRHSGTLNNEYVKNLVLKVGTTEVGTAAGLTSDKAIFTFPTAYTVPKGETKNFTVYGDITGGRANDTIQFYLDELSDLNAIDGTYGYGPTLTNNWLSGDQIVTIAGGQLTIGFNGPSATSYAQNTTNLDFLKFTLTAERAMTVKKIKVTAAIKSAAGALIAQGTIATNEDWDYLKNLKIVDLTTGNTLCGPLSDADEGTWNALTGYEKEFSDPFDLTAGTSRQLSVRADIDTLFTATRTIDFKIDLSVANYVYDTGAAQYVLAAKIVPNTLNGYQMTVMGSSLTIAKASTPVSTTVVKGGSNVEALGLILTAGIADAVKLNKLVVRVYADDDNATPNFFDTVGYGDTAANTIVSTLSLYDDAGTLIKGPVNMSLVGAIPGGYYKAEFTNLAYSFAAGSQKKFIVKANLLNTFLLNKYFALDVKGTEDLEGENSKGTSLTFVGQPQLNLAAQPSPMITCSQGGALTVAVDAATPNQAIVVAGTTGIELTKYKFTATDEAMVVIGLKLTNDFSALAGDYDDNIAKATLSYTNTSGVTEEKIGYFAGGGLTFAAGQVGIYVPKDSSSTLTIKADLTTIDIGADSGDQPKVGLTKVANQWAAGSTLTNDFIIMGASSGEKQYGLANAITVDNANAKAMVVRKTKPTLASGTLSGSLSTGTQIFYKWTVSADSAADMSWNLVTFGITGSLYEGAAFKVIGSNDTTTPHYDGIYGIVGANGIDDVQFVTEASLKVYNSATSNQVPGAFKFRSQSTTAGGYNLVFVPTAEEEIGKGATKTYELRGDFTLSPSANGNYGNINVKIADLTTVGIGSVTNTYALVAGANDGDSIAALTTTTISLAWSDKSAAAHTTLTADWANDYKVSGIPTTTLTMSK